MKYIDADKAKNGIMKFVNEYGEIVGMFVTDFNILLERCAADVVAKEKYDRLLENALIVSSALQKYQKADVVEVVRCKDCKYYIEREDGYICANDYLYKDSEWFCADGEKNE